MGLSKGKCLATAYTIVLNEDVSTPSDLAFASAHHTLPGVSRSTQIHCINRRIQSHPLEDLCHVSHNDSPLKSTRVAEMQTSDKSVSQSFATANISPSECTLPCISKSMQTSLYGLENHQRLITVSPCISLDQNSSSCDLQVHHEAVSANLDLLPTHSTQKLDTFIQSSLSSIDSIQSYGNGSTHVPAKNSKLQSALSTVHPDQAASRQSQSTQVQFINRRIQTVLDFSYLTENKSNCLDISVEKNAQCYTFTKRADTFTEKSDASVSTVTHLDWSTQMSPVDVEKLPYVAGGSTISSDYITLPSVHGPGHLNLLPVLPENISPSISGSTQTQSVHLVDHAPFVTAAPILSSGHKLVYSSLTPEFPDPAALIAVEINPHFMSDEKQASDFVDSEKSLFSVKSTQPAEVQTSINNSTESFATANIATTPGFMSCIHHSTQTEYTCEHTQSSHSKIDYSEIQNPGLNYSQESNPRLNISEEINAALNISEESNPALKISKGTNATFKIFDRTNPALKNSPTMNTHPLAVKSPHAVEVQTSSKRRVRSVFSHRTVRNEPLQSTAHISQSADTRLINRYCQTEPFYLDASRTTTAVHDHHLSPHSLRFTSEKFLESPGESSVTKNVQELRKNYCNLLNPVVQNGSAGTYKKLCSDVQIGYDCDFDAIMRKPSSVICYICGRQYGTASIFIHEKQCLAQFHKENGELPPYLRRSEPIRPHVTLETFRAINSSKTGSYNLRDINGAAFTTRQVQYMPCGVCGRTFLPDSLRVHARSCRGFSKRKFAC